MALKPQEVDIPIGMVSQSDPKHQGASGRLRSLVQGQVTNYIPASPGVSQKQTIKQRNAFSGITDDLTDPDTGSAAAGDWGNPKLLAPLGDQLLSIDGAIPRIYNGTSWTSYDTNRVLANRLGQDVFHTGNSLIQATDTAFAPNGNQCVVWSESHGEDIGTSWAGFKGANGAWIRPPFKLFENIGEGGSNPNQKVVHDGLRFWIFCLAQGDPTKIAATAFSDAGEAQDDVLITRTWTGSAPGYWDVIAVPSIVSAVAYTVILAQPGGAGDGVTDVDVKLNYIRFASGSASTTQVTLTGANCAGPLAFITSRVGSLAYLSTVGAVTGLLNLFCYQITNGAITHSYSGPETPGTGTFVPDSITGYNTLDAGGAPTVVLAASYLSEVSQPFGPTHDPALRAIVIHQIDRLNALTFIRQVDSVIAQSRAFFVDDDPFLISYYQSGGGLGSGLEPEVITVTSGDYMFGDPVQPFNINPGDHVQGVGSRPLPTANTWFFTQKAFGPITHNVGDSADASTATWTLLNGVINEPCRFAYLTITGSAVSTNNTSFRILSNTATTVRTETVGLNGEIMQDDTLAGVTANINPSVVFYIEGGIGNVDIEEFIPTNTSGILLGATITVSGSGIAANNTSYTVTAIDFNDYTAYFNAGSGGSFSSIAGGLCVTTFPLAGTTPKITQKLNTVSSLTMTPLNPFESFWSWPNFGLGFDASVDGQLLRLESGVDVNKGDWEITSVPLGGSLETFMPMPEIFQSAAVGGASIVLADPTQAHKIHLDAATFTDGYRLAYITILDSAFGLNDGTYQITQVLGPKDAIIIPVRQWPNALGINYGTRNQVLGFDDNEVVITVYLTDDTNPAIQPCWLITPLSSVQQMTVGRFEYGIAYADWRFDGASVPNKFPMSLSSAPHLNADGKIHCALPYRAQSFTAGQIARVQNEPFSTTGVLQTTVGIKDFSLMHFEVGAVPVVGQSVVNSGELVIPGPQASQFTSSGFTECGVNFAFEQPFLIEQTENTSLPVALSPGQTYQYIVVGEVTLENGDRVFSIPSAPLNVPLLSPNNSIKISGRMNIQTNHASLAISIYRTVVIDDVPTTEHYKITNDLDVNGIGFDFSTEGPGGVIDTWFFTDTIPDITAAASEQLYTDKGYLAHYPAPAFHHGIGSAFNRTWVIGYDKAVWMSAEKTEGDAVWFHPNWRYTLPTDDSPQALAVLDDYILVFCERSTWYIPKAQFPGANGRDGSLPTPVQLPFTDGCSGFVAALSTGIAYSSSTPGQVWLVTRNLTRIYLSESVKDDLVALPVIRGMAVDGKQRLAVSTTGQQMLIYDQVTNGWWNWQMATAISLTSVTGSDENSSFVYQGTDGRVLVQTPFVAADVIDATLFPVEMEIDIADISFAGVRQFAHLWGIQLVGQWKGPHTLNASLSYPDEKDEPDTEFSQAFPTSVVPYIYEINPMIEETSTFGLVVSASFEGVEEPADSFELEMITAEVGVEQGMNRVDSRQRIPKT